MTTCPVFPGRTADWRDHACDTLTSLKAVPRLSPEFRFLRSPAAGQAPLASLSDTTGICGCGSFWDIPRDLESEDTVMPTGTIARLLIDKGFGFIRDESGLEHFFHRSSVRGTVFELLREGQRVEFAPEDSQKGPRAGDIRLIE